jgi:hypothetical protein
MFSFSEILRDHEMRFLWLFVGIKLKLSVRALRRSPEYTARRQGAGGFQSGSRAPTSGSESDPIPTITVPWRSAQAGTLQPGGRSETAGKARAAGRPIPEPSSIPELHGGYRANASRRSATGPVCSPNLAALRARIAGIPVKNEVTTQIKGASASGYRGSPVHGAIPRRGRGGVGSLAYGNRRRYRANTRTVV